MESHLTHEQAVSDAFTLNTDELQTVLTALDYARAGKLQEREADNLPPTLLYDGDALPPVGTLDGDVLRIGALMLKVQAEAMRREAFYAGVEGETGKTE